MANSIQFKNIKKVSLDKYFNERKLTFRMVSEKLDFAKPVALSQQHDGDDRKSVEGFELIDNPLNVVDFTKRKSPIVILVAGMRHSGSTALFNIIRLALELGQIEYKSGYSEHLSLDALKSSGVPVCLIKIHELRDDILDFADIVITTKRDVRDAVASASRRSFPLLNRIGGLRDYAKYNRMLYEVWDRFSHIEFSYESFMDYPIENIRCLLSLLGIDDSLAEVIHTRLLNLSTDDYEKTLLTEHHITDPDRIMSFTQTLGERVSSEITSDHKSWLIKHSYQC